MTNITQYIVYAHTLLHYIKHLKIIHNPLKNCSLETCLHADGAAMMDTSGSRQNQNCSTWFSNFLIIHYIFQFSNYNIHY